MSLAEYFENVDGIGVLGTADAQGNVDLALYARPHVVDENTVAFIMGDHLSHDNVRANPRAAYLFVEKGEGYKGLRLYLSRSDETTDPKQIEAMRRRGKDARPDTGGQKFLVFFNVERTRRLLGR